MAEEMVDIVPILSPTGDFRHITDDNTYNNNNKVSTLFNLLEFVPGKNSLYPDMGIYTLLNSIPYAENLDSIISQISSELSKFLNFTVDVSYERDKSNEENIILNFNITGLPGTLKVDAKRTNGSTKIVNPRYIK